MSAMEDQFTSRPRYRIPFIDLKKTHFSIAPALAQALERVTKRQWYVMGPELAAFEREFARYLGARYCVGVGSGFDALKLSLLALGLERTDEVVLPANTFIATYLSVIAAGARPVLCDVDPRTHNVSVETLRPAVTRRTRVLLPVHLFGNPCPMREIVAFAGERGLHVVEDAAQAHGARIRGRAAGTFGDFGAFSFYPGKNLGAFGDGGAIVCRTRAQRQRLLLLRNYGFQVKNYAVAYGENSRLDEIHSAVLRAKLGSLDAGNAIRNRNADLYRKSLGSAAACQQVLPDAASCYHAFVARVARRDRVFRELRKRGIEAMIHYPWPVHRQPVYRRLSGDRPVLPVAERLAKQIISLPVDLHMDRRLIEEVAGSVRRLAAG
jgi:dTDP-4-amino-4,6-dideoxygalactose transaminase